MGRTVAGKDKKLLAIAFVAVHKSILNQVAGQEVVHLAAECAHGMPRQHDLDRCDTHIRQQDGRGRHAHVTEHGGTEPLVLQWLKIESAFVELQGDDFVEQRRVEFFTLPRAMNERQMMVWLEPFDVTFQRSVDAMPGRPEVGPHSNLRRVRIDDDLRLEDSLDRIVDQSFQLTFRVDVARVGDAEVGFLEIQASHKPVVHHVDERYQLIHDLLVRCP